MSLNKSNLWYLWQIQILSCSFVHNACLSDCLSKILAFIITLILIQIRILFTLVTVSAIATVIALVATTLTILQTYICVESLRTSITASSFKEKKFTWANFACLIWAALVTIQLAFDAHIPEPIISFWALINTPALFWYHWLYACSTETLIFWLAWLTIIWASQRRLNSLLTFEYHIIQARVLVIVHWKILIDTYAIAPFRCIQYRY